MFLFSEAILSEMRHICGVFSVNSHELPVRPAPAQALYCHASLLKHSCANNASKHFDDNARIVIRAAVQIKYMNKLLCIVI